MPEPTPLDLKKIIRDLSDSFFRYERYNAVVKLGQISESSEEVIRALAAAVSFDSDVEVRSAALLALQSPANQVFLKDRPNFLQEAMKSAVENHEREKQENEDRIRAEYLRRRTRERMDHLVLFISILAFFALFVLGAFQEGMNKLGVCIWQFIFISFFLQHFYMSWRNWRCPSCDAWLGGITAAINPIWSPASVRCSHCGKKLS